MSSSAKSTGWHAGASGPDGLDRRVPAAANLSAGPRLGAVANEITIPALPCRDIDETVWFYEALGFSQTYRQRRPNPYAAVRREDIEIHLFSVEGFEPERSHGNVIVVVPDPDNLYLAFANGLRAAYGKLPSTGIPRILRPRKKSGTVRGFSVVDPGGNWLRVSRLGDTEQQAGEARTASLARVIENAARLGDAKGDDAAAERILDAGLARFVDAPTVERARAFLFRAELAVRLDDAVGAAAALAMARALPLSDAERGEMTDDIAHAEELVAGLANTE
jgi:catechol 2,3-dioxygenase-like lactoylglutathione lyase family enzyme